MRLLRFASGLEVAKRQTSQSGLDPLAIPILLPGRAGRCARDAVRKTHAHRLTFVLTHARGTPAGRASECTRAGGAGGVADLLRSHAARRALRPAGLNALCRAPCCLAAPCCALRRVRERERRAIKNTWALFTCRWVPAASACRLAGPRPVGSAPRSATNRTTNWERKFGTFSSAFFSFWQCR